MFGCDKMLNELNKILNIKDLIHAFVEFYGIENEAYIINIFNNLRVIWYGESDIKLENITEEEFENIKKQKIKSAFNQSCYLDEFNLLILPQKFDITHIIHEINHKIGSHIKSEIPLVFSNGICQVTEISNVFKEEDSDLSEVINQLITIEIISILNSNGYKIELTSSWQEKLFPLVLNFYSLYKDEIKKCWITGDLTNFKMSIGMYEYIEFSQRFFIKSFRLKRKMSKGEDFQFTPEEVKEFENIFSSFKDSDMIHKR